jgi:Sulfotransferase family
MLDRVRGSIIYAPPCRPGRNPRAQETKVIISHSKRFVVPMPWKSASSTVRARLGALCESPYNAFYELNPILNRVVHQHMVYADFVALPESRLGYTTFAFVRNPYDRVYSGFRQLQTDIQQQTHADFPDHAVRRLVMAQLADNFAQLSRAGFAFEPWLASVEDHQVLETGRRAAFRCTQRTSGPILRHGVAVIDDVVARNARSRHRGKVALAGDGTLASRVPAARR